MTMHSAFFQFRNFPKPSHIVCFIEPFDKALVGEERES